jgi:hypothetical protein
MDYGFRLALLLQWMTRQSIKQCGNGPGVRPGRIAANPDGS